MGSKGIPATANLTLEQYLSALNTTNSHFVKVRSLQLKKGQMSRVCTIKKGLSDIFVKFQVGNDRISCSPLKINENVV